MRSPKYLDNPYAKKFWSDHSPALLQDGILTEGNADLFALLCEVWGELRTTDKSENKGRVYFIALIKHFQSISKQFARTDKPLGIADIIREGLADNA